MIRTPLHLACRHGNFPFVKILVENGADINAVDLKKLMPLNYIDLRIKENPVKAAFKDIQGFLENIGASRDWKKDSK